LLFSFYPRWKEYEASQAQLLDFSLDEAQWEEDWAGLLSLASQPGASLEQLHVFALAHILRRPIIIYGVKYVKSFRGEDIGYARFEGRALRSSLALTILLAEILERSASCTEMGFGSSQRLRTVFSD